MPVDPSIPLSVQTPAPIDPLAAYGRVAQLQSVLQGQQLQQAQLTGVNQENQQRQMQINSQQAIRKALIDSNGDTDKWTQLASQYGAMPQDVMAIQMHQANVRKTFADASKAEIDAHTSLMDEAAGKLNAAITATDPATKQTAWNDAVAFGQRNNLGWAAQSSPQYPGDDQAKSLLALTRNYSGVLKDREVTAQETQASAQATRAGGVAQDAQINQQKFLASERARLLGTATDQHSWDNARIALGRQGDNLGNIPQTFSPQLAQTYANAGKTPEQLSEEAFRRRQLGIEQQNADTNSSRLGIEQSKANGTTPNAQGVANRFQTKEIDSARRQLDQIHQLRSALGSALGVANDEQYVDPKSGKIAPQEMDDTIRAQLQQQMQNVTGQGLRIMRQYGGPASGNRIATNEFSDQPDQAQFQTQPAPQGGGTAKPGTPAPKQGGNLAPENTIVSNAQGQRLKKIGGNWTPIDANGNPLKKQ